jgi:DNA-directed RNA polymerase, omega subunit
MLHPSYTDLMKVVNKDVEAGAEMVVNSRYSIVLATAKRARKMIEKDNTEEVAIYGDKPLSRAVEELANGKLWILAEKSKSRKAGKK